MYAGIGLQISAVVLALVAVRMRPPGVPWRFEFWDWGILANSTPRGHQIGKVALGLWVAGFFVLFLSRW